MNIIIEYAFKSLRRNPMRTFQNIFGILMAITIISAVIFYNDLAGDYFIRSTLADIEVDMIVQPVTGISSFFGREIESEVEFDPIKGKSYLLNQSLVSQAEFYFESSSSVVLSPVDDGTVTEKMKIIGVEASYFKSFPRVFKLTQGSFPNAVNTSEPLPIFLPLRNQVALGVQQGDLVNVSYEGFALEGFRIVEKNFTVQMRVSGTFEILQSSMFFGLNLISDQNIMILPLWDIAEWEGILLSSLGMLPPTINERIHVRLNHDKLPNDPDAAATITRQFRNKIQSEMEGRVIIIDNIGFSVFFIKIAQWFIQFLLLFLSLPAIILALYMQKFSIEASLETRMSEITTLRTKGGDTREIGIILTVEILVLAIISTFVGIFLGDLLSQAIFQTKTFLSLDLSQIHLEANINRFNVQNIIFLITFSFIFVLISAYLPIKRMLSEQDIVAGLAEFYSTKPPLWKRIYLDLMFISLGLILILLQLLLGFGLEEGGFLFVIFAAAAPAIFWLGCILSLARFGSQLVSRTERIIIATFRKFSSLGEIIAKSTVRRPENLSKIIILLSLVFSFGVLISATAETTHQTVIYRSYALVGADVRINLATTKNDTLVSNVISMIKSVDPESQLLQVMIADVTIGGSKIRVIPTVNSFISISRMNQYYLRSGTTMQEVQQIFNDGGNGTIVNWILSRDFNISKQDRLFDWNVTIKGVAKILPNLKTIDFSRISIAFSGIPSDVDYQVLINEKQWNLIKPTITAEIREDLVILVTSNQAIKIKKMLYQQFPGYLDVITQEEIFTSIEQESAANFNGIFTIEFYLSILIASVGLTIFLFHLIYLRRKEMGTLIALGATRRQVSAFLIGDAATAAFFSVTIGTLIGLLTAYLLEIFNSEMSRRMIQAPLTVSLGGLIQLIMFLLLGIVLATMLATWRIQRLAPAQILRTE